MTVTEFSRKYEIPNILVYQCSFNTPTRRKRNVKNIPEEELIEACKVMLSKRVTYYSERLEIARNRLEVLNGR